LCQLRHTFADEAFQMPVYRDVIRPCLAKGKTKNEHAAGNVQGVAGEEKKG